MNGIKIKSLKKLGDRCSKIYRKNVMASIKTSKSDLKCIKNFSYESTLDKTRKKNHLNGGFDQFFNDYQQWEQKRIFQRKNNNNSTPPQSHSSEINNSLKRDKNAK